MNSVSISLRNLQTEASYQMLNAYKLALHRDLQSIPSRRKTANARQFKQRIISDYRNIIRNRQRQYLSELRQNLFNKLNSIIKNDTITHKLLNQPDRFGYTLNYSIQRANTRLIQKVNRIYSDNWQDRKLDVKNFYQQANEAVESQTHLQNLIEYNIARAFNIERLETYKQQNKQTIRVRLSDRHKTYCICNELAKNYSIDAVDLPPYHLHCLCYVVALR